jgi:hypothetical protein
MKNPLPSIGRSICHYADVLSYAALWAIVIFAVRWAVAR